MVLYVYILAFMGFESDSDSIKDFLSLIDTFKSEDLYSLFCDKENIESDIVEIEWSNIKENRKKLLEELWLEREKLFKSFYDFYWEYDEHVEHLADLIESRWDGWKTYGGKGITLHDLIMDADKILHEKLYRIIFDTVWKDEIKNVISWKNLEVDMVLSRVSSMVKYFFEVRKHEIRNILERCIQDSPYFVKLLNDSNCTVEDYINQFIDYYENDTLYYIFNELEHAKISKDYKSVDLSGIFGDFVTSIDLCLLAKFTPKLIRDWFVLFSSDRIGISLESEKVPDYRPMIYVYSKVCWLFDEVFPDVKRVDNIEWLDFKEITKDASKKTIDFFCRVLKNLKIHDNWAHILLSDVLFSEKIKYLQQLYVKHKWRIFPQLKEYFFTEVSKSFFNLEDFQLSLDLDDIISDLRNKYEYAKPHVWEVSKKQCDEMEKAFLKNEKDKFRTKFFDAFSKYSNFFDCLDVMEWFIFFEIFKPLLSEVQITFKEKLNKDYKEFVKTTLEEKFKKSHNNAKPKKRVVPVVKKQDKCESVERKKTPTNIVIEKKELPEWLVSDLEKYFWWKLNRKLARSLRSSFWEYKTSWYTKEKYWFDFDDEFFRILREHWFVCIDESTQSSQKIVDSQPDTLSEESNVDNWKIDIQTSKAQELLWMIDTLSSVEEKINVYIDILKELWYEFYNDNEDKIRGKLIGFSNSNPAFLGKFWGMIVNLINKTVVEGKIVDKKWEGLPIYSLDITWSYRVLVLKWKWRKYIYDVMNHDDYFTFLYKTAWS